MSRHTWSRRSILGSAGLLALPVPQQAQTESAAPLHFRTQFDSALLPGCEWDGIQTASNGGRQCVFDPGGAVITALAWEGSRPRLAVWRDQELVVDRTLPQASSAPLLLGGPNRPPTLIYSVGGTIYLADPFERAPVPLREVRGVVLDGATSPEGGRVLAVARDGKLALHWLDGAGTFEIPDAPEGRVSLDFDGRGNLHIAHERLEGIQYSRVDANHKLVHSELLVRPYSFHPVLLCSEGRIILAWRGESNRLPSQAKGSPAWQRLGRGGYIAAMLSSGDGWTTLSLTDSKQVVKPFAPIDSAYTSGQNRELRVFYEEFSPPSIGVGPDGVPTVYWADTTRRCVYSARLMGNEASAPAEVRAPIEQLTGPCLTVRKVPPGMGHPPLAIVTRSRTYLERIALPPAELRNGRTIDFLQADELAECSGLELQMNQMRRRPENPVIAVDPPGGDYDGAIVANIINDGKDWRATLMYHQRKAMDPTKNQTKFQGGRAVSTDGIRWTKLPPEALRLRHSVDGVTDHKYAIRFVEDTAEPNPQKRFKGLWRSVAHEPWGWLAVTSPDGETWSRVADNTTIVRADDDVVIQIEPNEVAERRFQATSISRSFCGRIAAQWTSPDGMHWFGERETLDWDDPFRAKPDRGTTGRILLESWSGPDDEDEIHGGYIFRDGDRWLLHYMKWTGDGHIYCGLASSRDGLNYSRVASGQASLPLGAPGSWDGARIALREKPFRVGSKWWQYYNGAGWKHGLAGQGARTSQIGVNAPQQTGLAEIEVGRWVHLQVARKASIGEFRTVPLTVERAHSLSIDADGLDTTGASVKCAVLDAATGAPIPGFRLADFDRLSKSGGASWKGVGLETLGRRRIRFHVRLEGHQLRLYGLHLRAVTAAG